MIKNQPTKTNDRTELQRKATYETTVEFYLSGSHISSFQTFC